MKGRSKITSKERFASSWKERGAFTDQMIEDLWTEALKRHEEQVRIAREKMAQLKAKRQGPAAPKSKNVIAARRRRR